MGVYSEMFEQTLLPGAHSRRESYSMAVSLLVQIVIFGALCLAPFVFTQVLPSTQLKSLVSGAPPKQPVAASKTKTSIARAPSNGPRAFRVAGLVMPIRRLTSTGAAQALETPPSVDVGSGNPNGVPYGISEPLPQAVPVKNALQPPKAIRVGTMSSADLIYKVQPEYPQIARSTRIQGVVEFTATISKAGTIEHLTLVRGHPMLVRAAQDAVLRWRYRPTILNGEPVEVITDIIVNFTLNQ